MPIIVSTGANGKFWPNEGGACNTLASAYLSMLLFANQAGYNPDINLSDLSITLADVAGFWGITIQVTTDIGPFGGPYTYVGLDAPTSELLPAESFATALSGLVKAGAQVYDDDPAPAEDYCDTVTQYALDLILNTCTDAASVVWSSRQLTVMGGAVSKCIWTALLETEKNPIVLCASRTATASGTLEFTPLGGASDAPDMFGQPPLYPVTPIYQLVEPINAITDQDEEFSVNQEAAMWSVHSKVIATSPEAAARARSRRDSSGDDS